MKRRLIILTLAALGLWLPRAGRAQASPRWNPVAVESTGSGNQVNGINNQGQMVGAALTGEIGPAGSPVTHACLWADVNTRRDLGALPGGVYSSAASVNNGGQVAGTSEIGRVLPGTDLRLTHAFLWEQAGGMRDLGALGNTSDATSSALAVNDLGQVAGFSSYLEQAAGEMVGHAFIWDRQRGMRDLGADSPPMSINSHGDVLGRDWIWTEARGLQTLTGAAGGGFPGAQGIRAETGPHGINDNGQFAALGTVGFVPNGDGQPRPLEVPLRAEPGRGFRNLEPGPGFLAAAARAVNARGQLLGASRALPNGFLYDNGAGMLDLNGSLAAPGWSVRFAGDLNDGAQILATGFRPLADQTQMVQLLLTPSDQPAPVRTLELYTSGSARAGEPGTGVLILGRPAPAGGAVVRLGVSGNTNAITVPDTLVLSAGETKAQFTIQTHPVPIPPDSGAVVSIITATYADALERTTFWIEPGDVIAPPDPEPLVLDLGTGSVTGGSTVEATLTLTESAPDGGTEITLRSSDAAASVPSTVKLPAGARTATFPVRTNPVSARMRVTVTASRTGTQSATLEIIPQSGDTVTIQQAIYVPKKRRLTVTATSTSPRAVLRVYNPGGGSIGTLRRLGGGRYQGQFDLRRDPAMISIRSSLGGSASAPVSGP